MQYFEGSTQLKIKLLSFLKQYKRDRKLKLWEKENLLNQAVIIKNILGFDDIVKDFKNKTLLIQEPDYILNTLIDQKIEKFNTEILLEIKECLVRSYIEENDITEEEIEILRKNIVQ